MEFVTSEVRSRPIVVVGAGAAGLAAGSRLLSHGFTNVTILEATGRTGGRVKSHVSGNEWVELGAQWIHGSGHEVYEFAAKNGFLLPMSTPDYRDRGTGAYFSDDGRTLTPVEQVIVDEVFEYFNTLRAVCSTPNTSDSIGALYVNHLEEFLKRKSDPMNDSLRRAAFDYLLRDRIQVDATPYLNELSIRNECDYVLEGHERIRLNIPYSDFLDELTGKISKTNVLHNKPVSKISFDPSKNLPVVVMTEDGDQFEAAHVIVTVSLGVLKATPSLFEPTLPERKRAVIEAEGFFGVSKIVFYYDEPFWKDLDGKGWNSDGFQILWPNDPQSTIKFLNHTKTHVPWTRFIARFDPSRISQNALVMWLSGEGSPLAEKLSDEQVIDDCTDLLRRFTSFQTIPRATHILRENWNSNPRILGTYSYITVAAASAGLNRADLAEPVWEYVLPFDGPKGYALLFAGEHTHSQFFGTVHGAVISGWREADRINGFFKSNEATS